MIAYDLLVWRQRQENDPRTLGDLFYIMNDALPDIALADALVWLFTQLATLKTLVSIENAELINNMVKQFTQLLPQNLAEAIGVVA